MKLATRISLFFLAALAVVLLGFSGSMYWLVRSHLFNQVDELTEAALDTLNVAVESGPQGFEWEVNDRQLRFEQIGGRSLVWAVFDDRGKQLDGSLKTVLRPAQLRVSLQYPAESAETLTWNGERWKIKRRELRANIENRRVGTAAKPPDEEAGAKRYPTLVLAAGTSLTAISSQLSTLVFALVGISIVIWGAAALFGKWMCRKALAPLTRISESIRKVSAVDLNRRLPILDTDDELEELGRAFNELLDRLLIAFDQQRRFAAEASHQLRTPLTAMIGHVDVSLRRDRSAEDYRQTLEAVHEQSTRMRQIVETLLFLTNDDADTAALRGELIELNHWIRTHISNWESHPRSRDFRLQLDSPPLCINAHDGLLREAVVNLLDNACKYSDVNSPITIQTLRQDNDIMLVIEDKGHGVHEDEVARVVDPFFRSVAARERGIAGTGLGLSIVHRIAQAFAAKLSVKSRIGHGSTFILTFQRAEPTSRDIGSSGDCRDTLYKAERLSLN